jgi:hypothetical protein
LIAGIRRFLARRQRGADLVVDSRTSGVLIVGPQVPVDVERRLRRRTAEPRLD